MNKCSECSFLRSYDTIKDEGGLPKKLERPVYYCDFRGYKGKDPYREYLEEKGIEYENQVAEIGNKIPSAIPDFCPKIRFGI